MTDETTQQKIERLEAEVKNLRLGMGALIRVLGSGRGRRQISVFG